MFSAHKTLSGLLATKTSDWAYEKAIIANGYSIYSITPKIGEVPTVFRSKVAPITHGQNRRSGGELKTIVPEREEFNDPVFERYIEEM